MDRQQVALIVGSLVMILLLYFGFNTKPPKQRLVEKSRAGDVELQETQNAIREAKASLPEDLRKYIQGLENIVEGTTNDSVRIEALSSLSATWFDQDAFVPAGYYAEHLAEIAQTAESWAIAGSTYGAGLTSYAEAELVELAMAGAVRSFESAISLRPDNLDYRINLAICYAEQPPATNPMKGIQLLLELNRSNPENISVLYHLARFGMRTGQYDKAKERLEKALSLDPTQRRLHCLMAELLRTMKQDERAMQYQTVCDEEGKR
ncbi:MAG TPA: tetratricopeptide repeat protein [Saprospiraceae bacterium]|nr:tetratricopeptide repeat protein [Saprospiraceae bacterium]